MTDEENEIGSFAPRTTKQVANAKIKECIITLSGITYINEDMKKDLNRIIQALTEMVGENGNGIEVSDYKANDLRQN